jgi:hypothetical protein
MTVHGAELSYRDVDTAAGQAVWRAGLPTPASATSTHAISIARLPQGWAWELIDIDGVTAAAGLASHQKAALGMAQRAALRFPGVGLIGGRPL